MDRLFRTLANFALITAVAVAVLLGGCSAHAGYRTYDPYYNDYHSWDNNEVAYYSRWEGETHREHKDFKNRSSDEQKDYWNWRHAQNNDHH
jgi:hypothetical protein